MASRQKAIAASPMSLRLRLTLWYSGVLATVLFVFGTAVYFLLEFNLTRQLDQTLEDAARQISENSTSVTIRGQSIATIPNLENEYASAVLYVQVWVPASSDAEGLPRFGDLERSSATTNLADHTAPLDADTLAAGQTGIRDQNIDGWHMRVLTAALTNSKGEILGYVQTAAALQMIDRARSQMLSVLLLGSIGAVAAAAAIGWLAADRALQPLSVITQTAQQISRADDLSRRIPIHGTGDDEVTRLSAAFNASMERLEQLFVAQRRFLADVSHELRTPLTAVRGNVDLLERMGGADPESLQDIRSETERMTRLVGDLLLLAQADSNSLPLARVPIDLDTMLLDTAREARVLNNSIQITIGEIDQASVLGDPDRLKQVVLNLVANAMKYTPAGGRVILGLSQVEGWARMTISDTGIGIPIDEQARVFDRFYRVDKARSRAMGGAGLGLSIAQRITQLHNGRLEVTSEGVPGKGTTFSLWLPLRGDTRPAVAAPHSAQRRDLRPARPNTP